MSDKVDDENHEAKKEANGHIDKAEDILDEVKSSDVNESQIGGQGSDADKLERFKDEVEAQFDQIQQDINANRIVAADQKLRALRKLIGRVLKSGDKRANLLKELRAIRKSKRKITLIAVAAAPGTEVAATPRRSRPPQEQQTGRRA